MWYVNVGTGAFNGGLYRLNMLSQNKDVSYLVESVECNAISPYILWDHLTLVSHNILKRLFFPLSL